MNPDLSPTLTGYHVPPSPWTVPPFACTSVPSGTVAITFPVRLSGLSRRLTGSPSVFATLRRCVDPGVLVAVAVVVVVVVLPGVDEADVADGAAACVEYVY